MLIDINILQLIHKIFEVDGFTYKFETLYTTLYLDNVERKNERDQSKKVVDV